MIDDQTRESGELQSLRGDGPQSTMEEMQKIAGMMPESQMQREMGRLEAAQGREFDLAFTEIVAKHQQSAIAMSKDEVQKGNTALKDIARNIIEKQTAERKQLLSMHEGMEGGHEPITSSSADRQRMAKD